MRVKLSTDNVVLCGIVAISILIPTLAPKHPIGVGIVMVVVSFGLLWVFNWRWEWLRRKGLTEWLYWGRGDWYPASRLGASMAALIFLTLGLKIIDSSFDLCPDSVWSAGFITLMISMIGAAIYDYRLHKRLP
jgi:hypothetical protein